MYQHPADQGGPARVRLLTLTLLIAAGLAFGASSAKAAPGDLDPTFGTDGIVVTDFGGDDRVADAAVDATGRIVVVGNSQVIEDAEQEIFVARYTSSGVLDPSFGGGDGFVQLHVGSDLWDEASAVALYDDGRIVIGGRTSSDPFCNTSCEGVVGRFTEDGLLDPSFSGDGLFTSGINFSDASALTVDASGRIVVGESTEIVRLTEAGLLDPSFDGDGRAPVDNGASLGVAIDGGGRIVATDYFNSEVTAVRLLANGAPDPAFDGNGYATASIAPGSLDFPEAMTLDASGRVLIVGQTLLPGEVEGRLFVLRYTSSGALDSSFDGDGVLVGDENSWAGGVTVDGSGRVLVAASWPGVGSLLRFLPDGTLDSSFGGETVPLFGSDISIDPAQRIVAAGGLFVARYLGGDAPPTEEEPPAEEPPANPLAPPSPTPPPVSTGQLPQATPRALFATAARVASIRGGAAFVRLRCGGQTACRGVAKLLARVQPEGGAGRRAAQSVVLGQARFRVPAGKRKPLRIRLSRKGQQLLRQAGRRGLRAQLVGRGLRSRTVRLKATQAQ